MNGSLIKSVWSLRKVYHTLLIPTCYYHQGRRIHASSSREAANECIHGFRAGDAQAPVRAAAVAAQRRAQQVTGIHVEVSNLTFRVSFYWLVEYICSELSPSAVYTLTIEKVDQYTTHIYTMYTNIQRSTGFEPVLLAISWWSHMLFFLAL